MVAFFNHHNRRTRQSIQRGLAALFVLAQALFMVATWRHVDQPLHRRISLAAVVQAADHGAVGVTLQTQPEHDPIHCPVCLAQNLDRGLVTVPVVPSTPESITTLHIEVVALAGPDVSLPFYRSRAPPALS